jgi:hypothetical protein
MAQPQRIGKMDTTTVQRKLFLSLNAQHWTPLP